MEVLKLLIIMSKLELFNKNFLSFKNSPVMYSNNRMKEDTLFLSSPAEYLTLLKAYTLKSAESSILTFESARLGELILEYVIFQYIF